ncbi:MAG: hypothetical protein K0U45_09500 [Alphaproteobacteria bacterium]|nr:hypothetical protein [Alphaproteobacteria bacterium]
MSPLYLDEKLLLLGIGSSYIAIIIFYLLIKNNLPNIYQAEKTFFSQFGTISLKPKSIFDYIAYLILLIIGALIIWYNFFPIGFKHFDSVYYISDIACKFERIQFQTFWKNRFFALAHQEWTILAPLLTATNCNLNIPFFLITAQYFIAAYLLFYIIPFEKLALRLITLAIIISNTSFFMPFSSMLMNDRDTLFLIIVFLYCFIHFFKTEKPIYLLFAFICGNTALYFKEPIFIYFTSLAFISFCFHLYHKQFKLIDIMSPLPFIRKQPIEILLLILSLCFVSLWAIFAFIFHPSAEIYGATDSAYLPYIFNKLQNYPLFALIILMIIGYIIDYKNIQKHQFSLMLFFGGLFYALTVSYLNSNLLYYYCIAELSILLAACYYLKNIKWQKNAGLVLTFLIASFIVFDTIKSTQNLVADLQRYKTRQYQITQTKQNLPLNYSDSNKIFYYKTNNAYYHLWIFKLLISQIESTSTPAFHLSSFQPCYKRDLEKQTAQLKCIQTDKWNPDDYDFTVFWRSQINNATWQSLQAQYGDKMQKITDFPAWLGDTTRYNIYVLQR